MAWNTCFKCKCRMWIDDPLNDAALRARGKIPFFCSYGHQQFYIEGESEETILRRDRDRLQQRLAEKDDTIASLERRRAAAIGQVTKIKNRVGHGVCPCCNRTFENVARHMMSKHPTFTAEAAE